MCIPPLVHAELSLNELQTWKNSPLLCEDLRIYTSYSILKVGRIIVFYLKILIRLNVNVIYKVLLPIYTLLQNNVLTHISF